LKNTLKKCPAKKYPAPCSMLFLVSNEGAALLKKTDAQSILKRNTEGGGKRIKKKMASPRGLEPLLPG